jgi:hypothetical protein
LAQPARSCATAATVQAAAMIAPVPSFIGGCNRPVSKTRASGG